MTDLFKLNRYFKKYKGTVLLGTLFLTLANGFLVGIPILVRKSIDDVQNLVQHSSQSYSNIFDVLFKEHVGIQLATISGYLVGAALLYGILLFLTRQTLIVTSRRIEFDIRNEIFDHLQKLPQSFYTRWDSSDIYVRATEDVMRVRDYFGPGTMYTINTFTRAGIIITIMFIVNARLTLWALIPLPILTAVAYWVSGYINERSRLIQEQYSRVAGRAQEAFSSIRLIKAYAREAYEQKMFDDESEEYRVKKLKLAIIEALFFPMLNLLIGISVILVIWKGGDMIMGGTLTVGNIAEFIIYVAYLTWPVASLGYTLNLLQRSAASQKRIEELMSQPVQIEDTGETDENIKEIKGEIEFNNVSFKYPESERYAVHNINMKIKAGQDIAIVGRTGSGKTSLIQLIPRLYDPQEGTILIDGNPINKIPLATLRNSVGFVPQDAFLFSDTIAENIAFGIEEADDNLIREAADKAQVLENILDFEKKFETILGERGITMSGGQKQRTTIARALIKNPSILIFDDSLSAVDTKTEDAILKHLKKEMKGKTTIMISHRISTIKNADIIYVMKDHTIVESGTHKKLIEKDGHYADMYKKQLIEQELAEI
ncbi:MAG TPA: ABC transporter ATP-binding protein [Balneolales bacterium]|nr:ABC transporter ATP-binding protein [Balneolales bacterium]